MKIVILFLSFILFMDNAFAHWNQQEEEQLKNFYLKYKMEIPEIAKIHKRSNEAIRLRLVKLNLIKDDNFLNSQLIELEKFKRENDTSGLYRPDKIFFLTEILSKYLSEQNEKIKLLEERLKAFELQQLSSLE